MNRTFKRERPKKSNAYNFNTTTPISHDEMWIVLQLPWTNPRWRTAAIFSVIWHMSISSDCRKIFSPNLVDRQMHHSHVEMIAW